jgi:hypothetical protein
VPNYGKIGDPREWLRWQRAGAVGTFQDAKNRVGLSNRPLLVIPKGAPPPPLVYTAMLPGARQPHTRVECLEGVLPPTSNERKTIFIDGRELEVFGRDVAFPWNVSLLSKKRPEKWDVGVRDNEWVSGSGDLGQVLQAALHYNTDPRLFEALIERSRSRDTPVELNWQWYSSTAPEPISGLSEQSSALLAKLWKEKFGDTKICPSEELKDRALEVTPEAKIEVIHGAMFQWLRSAGIPEARVYSWDQRSSFVLDNPVVASSTNEGAPASLGLPRPLPATYGPWQMESPSSLSRRALLTQTLAVGAGGATAGVVAWSALNQESSFTPKAEPRFIGGIGEPIELDERLSQNPNDFRFIGAHEIEQTSATGPIKSKLYRHPGSDGVAGYYRMFVGVELKIVDGKAVFVGKEDYRPEAVAHNVPDFFAAEIDLPPFKGATRLAVREGERVLSVVSDAAVEVQRASHTGDYLLKMNGRPSSVKVYTTKGGPNTEPPNEREAELILSPSDFSSIPKDWKMLLTHLQRHHHRLTNESKAALILRKWSSGFVYDIATSNAAITKGTTPGMVAAQAIRQRSGMCDFASEGLVALLRHAGVPARIPQGVVGDEEGGDSLPHAWVEFWDGHQWTELEPQVLSSDAPASEAALENIIDYRQWISDSSVNQKSLDLLHRHRHLLHRHRRLLRNSAHEAISTAASVDLAADAKSQKTGGQSLASEAALFGAGVTLTFGGLALWFRRVDRVQAEEKKRARS